MKHQWLSEKKEALSHLLFVDCEDVETRNIVMQLIDKIKYIKDVEYNMLLKCLAENIIQTESDPCKVQIVAMTGDSGADSAQAVIYSLKSILAQKDWDGYLFVNRYDHSYKEASRKGFNHTKIILVDNFIGSGDTVLGRIQRIKSQYGTQEIEICVKVVFCTEFGKARLESEGVEVYVVHELLKKVIDGFYDATEANLFKEKIRNIESKFLENFEGRTLHSLGYSDGQIALAIQDVNTPNNVLPIFWWKYYKNMSKRPVILHRAMVDA
ncbi:phosphoribosyltransferase-like protein [Acinetobacter variabilis]|uniref:phosphoribosyltransferase-like protein n=1 Tax=Acinetobacter variabilis TaxID=70346 RepID=UPI00289B7B3D|nr:hypothetical protein [Acinetobacter variabilis]